MNFIHSGDDFAFGKGDNSRLGSPPGVAKHLCHKIMNERKVKHVWQFFNQGIIGSNSRDWLPRSNLIINHDRVGKKNLFEKVFSSKNTESVEVVIIFLGFNDSAAAIPPEETVQNIVSICRVLRNLGKDVWLSTICNLGDKTRGFSDALIEGNLRRNEGLIEYLKNEGKKDGVLAGPRIDAESYEFRTKDFLTPDGIYFNNKGYLKLSKDFCDLIATSLVKREFDAMKSLLGF
ncbi:hypothetical protein HK100_004565 [Physocladia obscura]|uniref:SGNH hydrolase-type esterase domain-containing protein n=1 Tax=Physocladia obscura TaxID=109957 RepID=A0AAD5T803_9FUNG|nr:hypothetical protein HK100_004565 [Physocladia obscura]